MRGSAVDFRAQGASFLACKARSLVATTTTPDHQPSMIGLTGPKKHESQADDAFSFILDWRLAGVSGPRCT